MPGFPDALRVRQLREVMTGTPCESAALIAVGGDDGDGCVGAEGPPQLVNVRKVATANPADGHRCLDSDRLTMGRHSFLKSG
jgi:hypothetical protein